MSDLITNNDALRSSSPLLCTNILSSSSRGPDMTFYILTAGYPVLLGCDTVALGEWFPTFRPVLYYHLHRRHHQQQQHNDEKLWFRSNKTCFLDLESVLGHFLYVLTSLSWLARSPVEKRAEKRVSEAFLIHEVYCPNAALHPYPEASSASPATGLT